MVKHLINVFCVTFIIFYTNQIFSSSSDITVRELITGDQENLHIRILKAIPEDGQISIGPKDAKNIIIEFYPQEMGHLG